ncbi:serine/threonine-protein kinase HipA [Sphingomonas leidyi]|uniref:Serine/threonine-protein kinase HipA n=1 Tax=Sphingomonas leidyi TaxID=68569 RepID=A0A7X5UVI9_9SPHN|nr:type II toxin-antitoxin system HipA family toxin [Sphingomonas leidyi]NIJ63084.1 serine/threonine-protein kinase HipA [Sphingomonas leidyi]
MERTLDVHIDWRGETLQVGRLWARSKGNKETSSFEYTDRWRRHPYAFALDPLLPLTAGTFHTEGLFNAFTDPAPDRWGRNLLLRRERKRAKAEGRPARTLLDIDFLTLVEDENRLGALRFAEAGEATFLAHTDQAIPPIIKLAKLLSATTRILNDKESDDDLRLVLAPGASLGGARPKAAVIDAEGHLTIAKFPSPNDDWPVPRWEATAMTLARAAGIDVPDFALLVIQKRPVFVMRRFDRDEGGRRIPFISALTALAASDGDTRSYLELLDVLRTDGAAPERDAAQLWRRMVFNVLISNTDDHLRNHGYLRDTGGWLLAPAYDLNPMPIDVKPRHHALTLDEADDASSIDTAMAVAGQFGLKPAAAHTIAAEVAAAVLAWREVASDNGLSSAQIERMASAFEHADLAKAAA